MVADARADTSGRSVWEPYFCTAPGVMACGNITKMWYASCTGRGLIAYAHVYGRTFMLYNGNGLGRTGFGYAVLEEG